MVLLSLSFSSLRSLHSAGCCVIAGVADLRELVALVVVVAEAVAAVAPAILPMRASTCVATSSWRSKKRSGVVDADEVEDEEHAGRLVGAVSVYFRRNHAPLGVLGHPSYDLDVAVDAHVSLGRVEVRAAVLHDGAVSRLDDDNVVLAGCELLEAFVHATFDIATLWQYLRHGLLQRSCSGATITSPVESIA